MDWMTITKQPPPLAEWLEFYDGEKTLGPHPPFNHVDKLDSHGDALVNYLHNYTHWRHLTEPEN